MAYIDDKLYCQNPSCGGEIEGDEIAYDGIKLYHPGDCQLFAVDHLAMKHTGVVVGCFELINRETALRLLRDGGLEQQVRAQVKEGFFER